MPNRRSIATATVLLVLLASCTGGTGPSSSADTSALRDRITGLEQVNKNLQRRLDRLERSGGDSGGVSRRVQTLESRLAGIEQRLAIAERR